MASQLVLWVIMVVGLLTGAGSWLVAVSLLPTLGEPSRRIMCLVRVANLTESPPALPVHGA